MNKSKKIIIYILFFLAILLVGAIAFFNYSYRNEILPNIYINGENYSGMSIEEARRKLENNIKNVSEKPIEFSYKEKMYSAQPSEAGLSIDFESAIISAYGYGHDKNVFYAIKDELKLLMERVDLWIDIKINNNAFDNFISKDITKLENRPKNFSYKYAEGEFAAIPPQSGMVLDREKIKSDIINNFSKFKRETISIKLVKKEPEVTEDIGGNALLHAKNLIKKNLILKHNSSKWALETDDLALFVKFVSEESNASGTYKKVLGIAPDEDGIKNYITALVPQINQEPVNAQLEAKDGKVKVFTLDRDGLALNIDKSASEISKILFTAEYYIDDSKKTIEADLIVDNVEPQITIESIDNMGITSLLATGESDFSGSPKNRKHNISVGASKFHGILVGPQDEFSFVKILGEVGPKEGYLPELVIKKGATVPEYGGGLCQVSTTAFRAAILAGLEITERKAHAYAVKYYAPHGMDATIYPPHPDLRFKNNTPAYILIQTKIKGNKLYFEFYGSDDGRKVDIAGPTTYDKKTDGSMKAVFTQKVTDKDGNVFIDKKFYSIYKSPALYPHKNPLE